MMRSPRPVEGHAKNFGYAGNLGDGRLGCRSIGNVNPRPYANL